MRVNKILDLPPSITNKILFIAQNSILRTVLFSSIYWESLEAIDRRMSERFVIGARVKERVIEQIRSKKEELDDK